MLLLIPISFLLHPLRSEILLPAEWTLQTQVRLIGLHQFLQLFPKWNVKDEKHIYKYYTYSNSKTFYTTISYTMAFIPLKHQTKHAYPSFSKLCLQCQQILLLIYRSQIDRMYVLMPWPVNHNFFKTIWVLLSLTIRCHELYIEAKLWYIPYLFIF